MPRITPLTIFSQAWKQAKAQNPNLKFNDYQNQYWYKYRQAQTTQAQVYDNYLSRFLKQNDDIENEINKKRKERAQKKEKVKQQELREKEGIKKIIEQFKRGEFQKTNKREEKRQKHKDIIYEYNDDFDYFDYLDHDYVDYEDLMEAEKLEDINGRIIDLNEIKGDPDFFRKFGKRFINLCEKVNPRTTVVICRLTLSNASGFTNNVWLTISKDNIKFLKNIFKHRGRFIDFENKLKFLSGITGSDVDFGTNEWNVDNIEIYANPRKGKYREGAFFPYLLNLDSEPDEFKKCFDLSRYQVYSNGEDIDHLNCFIYSLIMSGLSAKLIQYIRLDTEHKRYIEFTTIKHIAEKYKLNIFIRNVEEKSTRPIKYFFNPGGDIINLACYMNHLFINETIPFNVQYFRYRDSEILKALPFEQQIKIKSIKGSRCGAQFYTETPKHQIFEILRALKRFGALKDLTLEDLAEEEDEEIKMYLEDIDEHKEYNFKLFESSSIDPVSKIYNSINNLYRVGGMVQEFIRKCVHGGVPLIEKKQKVSEGVVELDINSFYPYAATLCGIQTGTCKILGHKTFEEFQRFKTIISSAYLHINITKINRVLKYPYLKDLNIGELYVDLTDFENLIKYHKIEGEILEGLYWTDKKDFSLNSLIYEYYEKKRQAKNDADKKLYKLILNEIYGNSLRRRQETKKKIINVEDVKNYIIEHYNQIVKVKDLKNGTAEVEMFKRYTDHYNMNYFGCSICSTARSLLFNIIYNLEGNGINVFYSVTDSIFIRARDLEPFKKLYPDLIGPELGKFKMECVAPFGSYFIRKGMYCLHLRNGDKPDDFKIRAGHVDKEKEIYNNPGGIEKYFIEKLKN